MNGLLLNLSALMHYITHRWSDQLEKIEKFNYVIVNIYTRSLQNKVRKETLLEFYKVMPNPTTTIWKQRVKQMMK